MHLSQSALGYIVCFSDILNSRVSVLTAKKFVMGWYEMHIYIPPKEK